MPCKLEEKFPVNNFFHQLFNSYITVDIPELEKNVMWDNAVC